RLISKVHRMLEREVPDGECLKFCVPCVDSSFVFVIELGKTGCHFSASRTRRCYDHKRPGRADVVIFSVSFIADDERHIGRISWDHIVQVHRNIELFQTVLEQERTFLPGKLSDRYASHIEPLLAVSVDQAEY